VGIDDSYSGTETGRFRVLNEDFFGSRVLFNSGKLAKGSPAVFIDVDVTGLEFILLEFTGKEVIGDWVEPKIHSR
jgi:alpha-galactosidase